MKKLFINSVVILLISYILACITLRFVQEKLIFWPVKIERGYQYNFSGRFKEINIKTKDGVYLNSLLFKSDSSKGLILYLHGNAGSLDTWGEFGQIYTDLHYDVLMLDYRGYGKSGGVINSQDQLFDDLQTVYDTCKGRYDESKIIVLGYSLGTGLATKLASTNKPKLLILQAPYYSLTDLIKHKYYIIPTCLLKYKLETNKYIPGCKMPITIFHGDKDRVIYYKSSLKLKSLLKPTDKLFILPGQGHSRMSDNPDYINELKASLTN